MEKVVCRVYRFCERRDLTDFTGNDQNLNYYKYKWIDLGVLMLGIEITEWAVRSQEKAPGQ